MSLLTFSKLFFRRIYFSQILRHEKVINVIAGSDCIGTLLQMIGDYNVESKMKYIHINKQMALIGGFCCIFLYFLSRLHQILCSNLESASTMAILGDTSRVISAPRLSNKCVCYNK